MGVKIIGAAGDELARRFEKMPDRIFLKAVRPAAIEAGVGLETAMRAATPVKKGSLRKAWGRRTIIDRVHGRVTAIAGIRNQYQDPATGKIPNLYARRVNRLSRENKGFVGRAFRGWKRGAAGRFREFAVSKIVAIAKEKA